MAAGSELGRNPDWRDWYPNVPLKEMSLLQLPYGEPNQETLGLFTRLPKGSRIGDICGGEGRYALPLANMGYDVVLTDVDTPHLLRGAKKNMLVGGVGSIIPQLADVTKELPFPDGSLDAALNAGFGYLMPPDELDDLFGKMSRSLRSDGLLVIEFATNRDRRDGEGNSLIGEKEYNYGHEEGTEVLKALAEKHGIRDLSMQTKTIHFEHPYYMHNDLIIAHGFKQKI